jgi:hypothetical protein
LYLIISIGFSLDVLLHPGTPVRLMGQLARQRARPWLLVPPVPVIGQFVGRSDHRLGIYTANQVINPSNSP